MEKQTGFKVFIENCIVVVIILVLVQTFMEDFAILADWSWDRRRILALTGFAFDLFFTIEFLSRFISAAFDRRAGNYFFRRRGWIDFLASVPLLLFNSGPQAAALLLGTSAFMGLSGVLNILKVVKAVRIARILRLLRVLKIFKQIKYTDSTTAQRHLTRIITIAITVIVLSLFAYTVAAPYIGIPEADKKYHEVYENTSAMMAENLKADRKNTAMEFAKAEEDLLIAKERGQTIYTRHDNDYYDAFFGPTDYRYISTGEYGFFFDLRPLLKQQSRDNLLFFAVVIILVAVYLIAYSPHFAITVTDPIHVMRRGMEDPSYNLEVKIPDRYAKDDVFRLAALYNEVYLPLKDRSNQEEGNDIGSLSMDDFENLFDTDEKDT